MKNDYEIGTNSKRDENSLFILTRKFIKLIYSSAEQLISMTQAAEILQVAKRRIYDITNVLEGLGMVSKWSVNSVKWIGGNVEELLGNEGNTSDEEASKKQALDEKEIDEEIENLNIEIAELSSNEKNLENAYVTYEDLQNLKIFQNKLVFAVKAPSDTTMEYPRYQKGAYRLRIMAESGQISVYYVNNEGE
ncbi:hypothetical protein GINT2_000638 [Glugoides intestinalis]